MTREFDAFLFATLGEEANGMLLTVATVLARLGLDPWAEARRLATLPKASALRRVAQLIASQPAAAQADMQAVAGRLVDLLPQHEVPPELIAAARAAPLPRSTVPWLIGLVLLSALLFVATARGDMSLGRTLVGWIGHASEDAPTTRR